MSLQALELIDGDLAMINRDEVNQLLVLFDVKFKLLDICRISVNIFLNSRLGLEETLESRLSERHLLELCFLVALFGL